MKNMTDRELAIVLAALRYFQTDLDGTREQSSREAIRQRGDVISMILDGEPPKLEEIDVLAERLNATEEVAHSPACTPILHIERDGQPVTLTPACLAQALSIDPIQAKAMILTFNDRARAAEAIGVLHRVERFIAGFEDDPCQEGVNQLLADIRKLTDVARCPNDTDGDGDCHLCHRKPGGCIHRAEG